MPPKGRRVISRGPDTEPTGGLSMPQFMQIDREKHEGEEGERLKGSPGAAV
jgi:hypothetical protein